MKRLAVLLGKVVTLGLFLPVGGFAQPSQDCGWYWLCAGVGEHEVNSPSDLLAYPHSYCAYCVYGNCHPACGATDADPDVQTAYQGMIQAAAEQDVDAILRYAKAGASRYVHLNRARSAIQIWSCSATEVVASIPIEEDMVALAAEILGTGLPSAVAARLHAS